MFTVIFIFREFTFLFKKTLSILIISLVKVGDAPVSYQNNAFFILILNSFLFGLEIKFNPFAIPQLNFLNLVANLVTIFTIFGGLFSSINQQTNLSLILMIVILGLNLYFLLLFLKYFIQIRLSFVEKFSHIFYFLNKFYNLFWPLG